MADVSTKFMRSRNWDTYFHECDEKHEYPLEWAEATCELGSSRIPLSEEHDGLSAGWVTLTAAYETLGCEGGSTYVLYQLPCWDTVLREGIEEQKEKILSFIGTGKQILNHVMIEPSAGSSWDDICIIYTRRDGKVYFNGYKTFITSSLYVSYLMVMARNSEDTDTYTEWFADMNLPDITKEPLAKLGLRMDSCCDVYFDNAELEEEDLFGEEGNGSRRGAADFDLERFLAVPTNYGTAYYAFEDAAKYVNQRIQGGQAVVRHQLIQFKFAEMKVCLVDMHDMLYEIVWKHDNGQLLCGDCPMVKYYRSETPFEAVDRALQVLAGVGITGDYHIQRSYRDLRVDRISGGTDEMMIFTTGHSVLYPYR